MIPRAAIPLRSLILVPAMLALLLNLAGCTPLGLRWLAAPKTRIDVIVPAGYAGPVLIAYQVPGGVVPEKVGDAWQFRLQDDGALLLQSDPLPGIGQFAFFYELADGTRQPIPVSSCFDDEDYEGAVVCTGGMHEVYDARELRPNESYFVGRLAEERKMTSVSRFWVLTNACRRCLMGVGLV